MNLRAFFLLTLLGLPGCPGPAATDAGTDVPSGTDTPAIDAPAIDAPPDLDVPAPSDTPEGVDAPLLADVPVLDAPEADAPAEPASCDARSVLCDRIPPTCGVGEAPSVMGSCWGPCIPATLCTCTTADECPDIRGYSETCYPGRGFCGPFL